MGRELPFQTKKTPALPAPHVCAMLAMLVVGCGALTYAPLLARRGNKSVDTSVGAPAFFSRARPLVPQIHNSSSTEQNNLSPSDQHASARPNLEESVPAGPTNSDTAGAQLSAETTPSASHESEGAQALDLAGNVERSRDVPHRDFWPKAFYSRDSRKGCDLGDGHWVLDRSQESLGPSGCTFPPPGQWQCAWRFDQSPNYRAYRWQPQACDLPLFDAKAFLDQWRDKTILFAGDSLGLNLLNSLMCKLLPFTVFTFQEGSQSHYMEWKSKAWNVTIGRAASVFLLERRRGTELLSRFNMTENEDEFVIDLEELDSTWAPLFGRSDLLILSAGHWWISWPGGRVFRYIQGGALNQQFDWISGFEAAMETVRKKLAGFRGKAVFLTFSPSHFEYGRWNTGGTCGDTSPRPDLTLDDNTKS